MNMVLATVAGDFSMSILEIPQHIVITAVITTTSGITDGESETDQ